MLHVDIGWRNYSKWLVVQTSHSLSLNYYFLSRIPTLGHSSLFQATTLCSCARSIPSEVWPSWRAPGIERRAPVMWTSVSVRMGRLRSVSNSSFTWRTAELEWSCGLHTLPSQICEFIPFTLTKHIMLLKILTEKKVSAPSILLHNYALTDIRIYALSLRHIFISFTAKLLKFMYFEFFYCRSVHHHHRWDETVLCIR